MPHLRCANAPTTAGLFVRLSMRRHAVSCGHPFFDLLLPFSPRAPFGAPSGRLSHIAKPCIRPNNTASCNQSIRSWRGASRSALANNNKTHTTPLRPATRAFSTSPAWRATHPIFNPRLDEEGNEMALEITPRAAKRLSEIMAKDSNPNLALRIQVESGGCHGFQYLMKLVTLPPSLPDKDSLAAEEGDSSAAIREDDTIFTYVPDDSPSTPDLTAPKVILDLPSLGLLKGSKVDFTMELIGSQFKIVDNPAATSSCGCGSSFDVKI